LGYFESRERSVSRTARSGSAYSTSMVPWI